MYHQHSEYQFNISLKKISTALLVLFSDFVYPCAVLILRVTVVNHLSCDLVSVPDEKRSCVCVSGTHKPLTPREPEVQTSVLQSCSHLHTCQLLNHFLLPLPTVASSHFPAPHSHLPTLPPPLVSLLPFPSIMLGSCVPLVTVKASARATRTLPVTSDVDGQLQRSHNVTSLLC